MSTAIGRKQKVKSFEELKDVIESKRKPSNLNLDVTAMDALVKDGFTNIEIGVKLGISPGVVRYHMRALHGGNWVNPNTSQSRLSDKEIEEIVMLAQDGMNSVEIANKYQIHTSTVLFHVNNALGVGFFKTQLDKINLEKVKKYAELFNSHMTGVEVMDAMGVSIWTVREYYKRAKDNGLINSDVKSLKISNGFPSKCENFKGRTPVSHDELLDILKLRNDGMSFRRIAEVKGVAEQTVRNRFNVAIQRVWGKGINIPKPHKYVIYGGANHATEIDRASTLIELSGKVGTTLRDLMESLKVGNTCNGFLIVAVNESVDPENTVESDVEEEVETHTPPTVNEDELIRKHQMIHTNPDIPYASEGLFKVTPKVDSEYTRNSNKFVTNLGCIVGTSTIANTKVVIYNSIEDFLNDVNVSTIDIYNFGKDGYIIVENMIYKPFENMFVNKNPL